MKQEYLVLSRPDVPQNALHGLDLCDFGGSVLGAGVRGTVQPLFSGIFPLLSGFPEIEAHAGQRPGASITAELEQSV